MALRLAAADDAFREDVRAFLSEKLTTELRDEGRNCTGIYSEYPSAHRWHEILAERGWSVPRWPVEHGGTGWNPLHQYIFSSELAKAGAPTISPNATGMVGPVIIKFGTQSQKDYYLPRIRSGEDWWAQGYSEPGAGSDLAALSCSATADGADYIVSGSKIWTTHAHFSNRIFCLVRTRKGAKPQEGISFLLMDLNCPGIEIRPILSMSGEHELNQVYFDGVRVPRANLVGAEHEGWSIAKYLLVHERSNPRAPMLRARLGRLRARARAAGEDAPNRPFALKLADAEVALSTLEISELRRLAPGVGSDPFAATPSVMKVLGTELRQRIDELALELEGIAAAATLLQSHLARAPDLLRGARASSIYLNDRAASIYAGTNEIQRGLIAKALLDAI